MLCDEMHDGVPKASWSCKGTISVQVGHKYDQMDGRIWNYLEVSRVILSDADLSRVFL